MKGCSVRELSEAAQCSAVQRSAAAQLDSTELRALLDGLPAALLGTSVGAAVIGALLPDPLPEPPLVLTDPLPLPETSCVGVLLGDALGTLGHLTSLLLPFGFRTVCQSPSGE